jgi:uncharacterized membrane protein YqjE
MIWDIIAHIFVIMPTIIYVLVVVFAALGFMALLVLLIRGLVIERKEKDFVSHLLGFIFFIILVSVGFIFGS